MLGRVVEFLRKFRKNEQKAIEANGVNTPSPIERSKYAPLYHYLSAIEGREWRTSFDRIEAILGFQLPASARTHRAWWANETSGAHVQKHAWLLAGWKTADVNMNTETLVFVRQ